MKHARKLASLLLALVMVLSLATTAFATQEGTLTGGSITINDAVPGQTYNVYQILYLESYNKDAGTYAYKANSAWETWLKTQTTYVSFDTQGYVTWVAATDDATVQAFAKLAQAQIVAKTADASATADSTSVTLSNLKLGYYLVDTTLGTLCSLSTTNPAVVMEEKNEAPSNVKNVEEDSTNTYGEKNAADIGQTVNFKSTITAQPGAENYVFHDTMSTGLTLDKASIKVNNVAVTDAQGNDVSGDNYTVSYPSGEGSDGCTFEIAFAQEYLNTITNTTTITITYSATLNENAAIAGTGNINTSKLSYGDSSNTKYTPASQTTTNTWDFNIFKYTKNAQNQEVPLSGAKFTLSKNANGSEPISLIATTEVGNSEHEEDEVEIFTLSDTTMTYRVAKEGETGVTEFEVGSDGKVIVQGLDAGTYYLTETQAPAGYNKLPSAIKVTIDSAGNVKKDAGTEALANKTVKVENQAGTLLPSTGGMGTTIFYVLGSILAIGAAVLLVTKKRMNAVDR